MGFFNRRQIMKILLATLTCLSLAPSVALALERTPGKNGVQRTAARPSMIYEGNSPRASAAAAAYQAVTPEQLAAAERVLQGTIACEFDQQVRLEALPERPGHFRLAFKGQYYTVVPEPTTTGAVRLEDKRAGVVWLQIPAKSMMMNSRLGQRMVDDCKHPTQIAAR
jgi:hypothetical protein